MIGPTNLHNWGGFLLSSIDVSINSVVIIIIIHTITRIHAYTYDLRTHWKSGTTHCPTVCNMHTGCNTIGWLIIHKLFRFNTDGGRNAPGKLYSAIRRISSLISSHHMCHICDPISMFIKLSCFEFLQYRNFFVPSIMLIVIKWTFPPRVKFNSVYYNSSIRNFNFCYPILFENISSRPAEKYDMFWNAKNKITL